MTKEQLAHLRSLVDKATPGPWQARFIYRSLRASFKSRELVRNTPEEQDWPDAEFIAAARSAVPELCDEVERLQTVEVTYVGGIIYANGQAIADHSELPKINEELVSKLAEAQKENLELNERGYQETLKVVILENKLEASEREAEQLRQQMTEAKAVLEWVNKNWVPFGPPIPCPDNKPGCLVAHYGPNKIRALLEKFAAQGSEKEGGKV